MTIARKFRWPTRLMIAMSQFTRRRKITVVCIVVLTLDILNFASSMTCLMPTRTMTITSSLLYIIWRRMHRRLRDRLTVRTTGIRHRRHQWRSIPSTTLGNIFRNILRPRQQH
jgi:hypothetical protein